MNKVVQPSSYIQPKLSSTVPESIKKASTSSSSSSNNNRTVWNIGNSRSNNEFNNKLSVILNGNDNSVKVVDGLYKQLVQGNLGVGTFLKRVKKHVETSCFLKLIEFIIKVIPNEELSNDLAIEICEYQEEEKDKKESSESESEKEVVNTQPKSAAYDSLFPPPPPPTKPVESILPKPKSNVFPAHPIHPDLPSYVISGKSKKNKKKNKKN